MDHPVNPESSVIEVDPQNDGGTSIKETRADGSVLQKNIGPDGRLTGINHTASGPLGEHSYIAFRANEATMAILSNPDQSNPVIGWVKTDADNKITDAVLRLNDGTMIEEPENKTAEAMAAFYQNVADKVAPYYEALGVAAPGNTLKNNGQS